MSMTMEQVVALLQQMRFSLRAQVAAQSGFAEVVRAIGVFAEMCVESFLRAC